MRATVPTRTSAWRALAVVLATVMVVGAWQATAEPSPSVVAQTPTTTRDLLKELLNGLFPTTTAPSAVPAPGSPEAGPAPGQPGAPGGPAAPKPPPTAPPGPAPDVSGLIRSAAQSGGRTTLPLLEALGKLKAYGFTEEEAALMGMGHFPVGGPASYRDDFNEFRAGPPVHGHQGTDIFANQGTPIRAPFNGVVTYSEGGLGGKMAYVTVPDGTYYFMAHLHSFALPSGTKVKQGQIVGTVGNTGNASGGAPHLHFEIHPGGGGATNPKPILDQWLDEAIRGVPQILASFKIDETGGGGLPRALTDAGLLRRFDPPRTASDLSELNSVLWAAATESEDGGQLAELEKAQAQGRINEQQAAAFQEALRDAWLEARHLSRAVLLPVTPVALEPILNGQHAD